MSDTSGYFKGYYFRHQNACQTVAVIPGTSDSGAFVQVITDHRSYRFSFPDADIGRQITVGDCTFSRNGLRLALPGITGRLQYARLTPIRSDIMGPFRFFPMECRHGILSMRHDVYGSLLIDGERYRFDGGTGYMECDSGRSFPRRYLWLQANDFPDASIMLSVADIPFAGREFEGCLAVVMVNGTEYRLATYRGAKATCRADTILLRQGRLRLHVEVLYAGTPHALAAPQNGQMCGVIHETNDAVLRLRLWSGDTLLGDWYSRRAAFERHGYT